MYTFPPHRNDMNGGVPLDRSFWTGNWTGKSINPLSFFVCFYLVFFSFSFLFGLYAVGTDRLGLVIVIIILSQ